MILENNLQQLHEDCEILKARQRTPEAEEQHKNNSLRKYAELYFYYRGVGCSRKESRQYALWSYENLVRKDL